MRVTEHDVDGGEDALDRGKLLTKHTSMFVRRIHSLGTIYRLNAEIESHWSIFSCVNSHAK